MEGTEMKSGKMQLTQRIFCVALAGFAAVLLLSSCETASTSSDEAAPVEDLSALDSSAAGDTVAKNTDKPGGAEDFALDEPAKGNDAAAAATKKSEDDKNDMAQFEDAPPQAAAEPPKIDDVPPPMIDPPKEEAKAETPPPPEVQPEPPVAAAPAPPVQEPPPPAPEAPAPVVEAPAAPAPVEAAPAKSALANIKSIQFKGNDNGGTLVIQADSPLAFTTRLNAQSGQFVLDIPNSQLAKKLTRPLITKDFAGSIGSVDAYQDRGSTTARVVVHLRPGATEPVVQAEGNSLLVVTSEGQKEASESGAEASAPEAAPEGDSPLMGTASLSEFLASENKFNGKKISIETDDMELGDLFRLIADEGGVNLVLGLGEKSKEKVKLKLRQVPWDQVLIMVMKANKLGYTRTGNVLRIIPMTDLQAEEAESIKLSDSKKNTAPLLVKMIPISYADVGTLGDKIKPFLTPGRGSFFTDTRTASLVVSDIEENLDRIMKVVKSIDIPPQQVLIEGKIIEAQENFTRQIGINWNSSGLQQTVGQSGIGPVTATMPINVNPGTITTNTGSINLQLGVLDVLGNLNATLTLQEQEGHIHVLASPRIVTMHNEPATMTEVQEIPYKTAQPTSLGNAIPQVTFVGFKLEMQVTPLITNEGGVIMKIKVIREFPGEIVDATTQSRPKNNRQAETRVLVRNGQTAVIGGIFENDSNDAEYRVPWLGSIPVVGWLFKSNARGSSKQELLIFVTPRILAQLDGKALSSAGGEGVTQ
jgi:type IV pilus assembly protein PilQ